MQVGHSIGATTCSACGGSGAAEVVVYTTASGEVAAIVTGFGITDGGRGSVGPGRAGGGPDGRAGQGYHDLQFEPVIQKYKSVLLGSASPSLIRTSSETLAGRLGLLELTPFISAELTGTRTQIDRWFWGGFPRVHQLRGASAQRSWLDAHVTTLLERDLPALGLSMPPARLRVRWTMLTDVHGQVLNVSDLARSLAVSSHTVNSYLDVLEGTFMIRRLAPFFANIQKRLTKAPKVYIRDTGLLHFLAGRPRESPGASDKAPSVALRPPLSRLSSPRCA